jgi:hypothetical protein
MSLFLLIYSLALYVFSVLGLELLKEYLVADPDLPALQGTVWYGNRLTLNYEYFHNAFCTTLMVSLTTQWLPVFHAAVAATGQNSHITNLVFYYFVVLRCVMFVMLLPMLMGFLIQLWNMHEAIELRRESGEWVDTEYTVSSEEYVYQITLSNSRGAIYDNIFGDDKHLIKGLSKPENAEEAVKSLAKARQEIARLTYELRLAKWEKDVAASQNTQSLSNLLGLNEALKHRLQGTLRHRNSQPNDIVQPRRNRSTSDAESLSHALSANLQEMLSLNLASNSSFPRRTNTIHSVGSQGNSLLTSSSMFEPRSSTLPSTLSDNSNHAAINGTLRAGANNVPLQDLREPSSSYLPTLDSFDSLASVPQSVEPSLSDRHGGSINAGRGVAGRSARTYSAGGLGWN